MHQNFYFSINPINNTMQEKTISTTSTTQQKQPKKSNKTLLRQEKPIYKIQRQQNEGQTQYMIKKLLEQKKKPQIQNIQRSELFGRLQHFMPKFKQENEKLQILKIDQDNKFDATLQQVQDSSESSEQAIEQEEEQQGDRMVDEKQEQQINKNANVIEMNFLTYPFPSASTQSQQPKNKIMLVAEVDETVNEVQNA